MKEKDLVNFSDVDPFKTVDECKDLNFLEDFKGFVQMDIDNLDKPMHPKIQEIKEKMWGEPLKVQRKKQREYFTLLIKAIEDKIAELS